MKRKFICGILSVLLIIAGALLAVGCGPGGPNGNDGEDEKALIDISVDCSVQRGSAGDIFYDGSPKTIDIKIVKDGEVVATVPSDSTETDDLTVEYFDNINAGNARAVVSAKPGSERFKGSEELSFEIKRAAAEADSFEKLKQYAESSNYGAVTLTADISVEEGQTLAVADGITLAGEHVLTNYGEITNAGAISIKDIRNYGAIENSGSVELPESYKLYNYGRFTGGVKVYDGYELFTVSGISVDEQGSVTPNTHILTVLGDCTAELAASEFDWTGSAIEPDVTIKDAGGQVLAQHDLTITYKNNTALGEATVSISAGFGSEYFYGELEAKFEIISPIKTVRTDAELAAVFGEPNYRGAVLQGDETLTEAITVPQNMCLIIDASYDSFPVAITNNGRLVVERGKTVYFDEDIVNAGAVENRGKIYISGAFTGAGTIANSGEIYSDSSLSGVTSSEDAVCVTRVALAAAGLTLSQSSFDYAGSGEDVPGSVPTVKIGDADLEDCSYTILTSDGSTVEAPKLCGEYSIVLTADKSSEKYFGEKTLTYSIIPSVFVIDSSSKSYNFAAALDDDGYYKLQVGVSVTCTADAITKEVEITSGGVLRIGKTLSVQSEVVNNGAIVCFKYEGEAQPGTITIGAGGSVANNGGIYVNAMSDAQLAALTAAVSGNVYNRVDISDTSRFQIDFNKEIPLKGNTSVAYIEIEDLELSVVDRRDSAQISADEYTVSVAADKKVCTKNDVRVAVVAKDLSTEFFGSVYFADNKGVNIVPGKLSVGSFADFAAALTLNRNQLYNWSEITVASSFAIRSNITIPPEVTVYIDKTTTSVWADGGKITVRGQLIIDLKLDAGNRVTDSDISVTSTGRVVYKVTDMMSIHHCLSNVSYVFTKLELKNDIACGTYTFDNYSKSECVIDLNGHTLKGVKLKMQIHDSHNTGALRFISSATAKGTITRATGGDYALTGSIESAHELFLDNLNIHGMWFEAASGNVNGTINASDCVFTSDGSINAVAPVLLNAAHTYKFTGCEFEGYCGVRISRGTAELTNCNITALGAGVENARIRYGNSISVVSLSNVPVYVNLKSCALQYEASGYGIYVSAEQAITSVSYAKAQINRNAVTYSGAVNHDGYSAPYNSSNSPFKS